MTKKTRLRTLLIGGLFTLLFISLIGRMYWIQVVKADAYVEMASKAWDKSDILKAVRGSIVDRNDKVLSEDVPAYTVSLNPQIVNDQGIVEDVVIGLAQILKSDNTNVSELEKKIRDAANKKKPDGSYYMDVEIRNEGMKIDKSKRDAIIQFIEDLRPKKKNKANSSGIYLRDEKKRYYPNGTLAAHVLGYVNKEGEAIQGVEKKYNDVLTGTPGKITTQRDAKGVELPNAKADITPPVNGKTLRLTIDKNIQFMMENTLEKYYQAYRPKSITAVAADPKTMEILGMVNFPNFNPNDFWNYNVESFTNQAVTAQYEPGSTFKIVTLAATVKEGIFKPGETYQSGKIKVPGNEVHDYNRVGWGVISYLNGLKHSSNVAFVNLGYYKLGQEKLVDYIKEFGFGEKTGIDLPAEGSGSIPMKWPSDFARATFGQNLYVTTIQQLAAYGAIANDGMMMWPHVVKEIVDPVTNNVIQKIGPTPVKQVVPPEAAREVTNLLAQTVQDPDKIATGLAAQVKGYNVAGKTGTANIVVNGKYSLNTWVTSFCGYAPADDPKVVMCIVADQPDLGGDYKRAKEVAPKAFSEMMEQVLTHLGVPSSEVIKENKVEVSDASVKIKVPDLSGLSENAAKNAGLQAGLNVVPYGTGTKVVLQYPPAGTEVGASQRVYVAMQQPNTIPIPDFTGMSQRDALELCNFLSLVYKINGEGYVVSQEVEGAGEVQTVVLNLMPPDERASLPTPTPDPKAKSQTKK
ncbi:PASTA domain-containing protein [Paenibacillus albiflavus]|uniref:PASTA domain-containing protein n=1 Tax=Paenibacillus albiflavus TaxID=2545760 RepID=A0A4R4EC88_9BACL|nr:penicillin-binding protein 2 [Paenibacillus albiflavus]TCZ75538.1 PASTA domain-containing protein [Paenibacillus albiflavus]